MIEIKNMDLSHIEGIALLEKECFSLPWSEESIKEELDNPQANFFAAIENGEVVGYIGCMFVLDEGYITNIAVKGTHRRRGIGSMLLQELINRAEEKKMAFVSLEVRTGNKNAISLYEKHGFKTLGIRKNFYEKPVEDGAIMTKYL